ncbi:TetR/AcrR family transcriptional regulator [Methylococcus sp. EFPC2]|uniref:TetR/AcrR family transcriptional regulator n=1 Tax=Methylococcus sp. EFPC2 TaxID=2812648 RepID=UPI0019684EAF|nr:TetR/AcrR family transcriptional regulator [Methylococcus sp. EFPC2]QSA96307.1 helix-turn-helix transcriptional regulator [Methylococcus sp. EFPC2]
MARPREFSLPETLDKAMRVFWAKGYFGTSIEDLVAATGVSRYGLYGEFGDKKGLFLAALQHYQANVVRPLLDIVERPEASLADLRALFAVLAEFSRQPGGKLGCLVFNSVNEAGLHDEATAGKILEIREHMAKGIHRMLVNAVSGNELPAGFDVQREADFLFGVLHALPMMARAGADPATIANVIQVALSTLD